MTLILSNEEVEKLLDVKDCIEILEDAYREQAAGRAISQLRMDTEVPIAEANGVKEFEFKTMVGILPKKGNRRSSLQRHHSAMGSRIRRIADRLCPRSRRQARWSGSAFQLRDLRAPGDLPGLLSSEGSGGCHHRDWSKISGAQGCAPDGSARLGLASQRPCGNACGRPSHRRD